LASKTGEVLEVEVIPLSEESLQAVEQRIAFDWGNPCKHRNRLREQQSGKAAYLIAWYEKQAIGHALVKWDGPAHHAIAARLDNCAEIEDLFVHPSYRSRGVGFQLLSCAEQMAKQRRFPIIGLGVAVDNSGARRLYEHKDFKDTALGEYTSRWPWRDQDGNEQWAEETCCYLIKRL
jgi:GNAT superfamily N-acetyltransferase